MSLPAVVSGAVVALRVLEPLVDRIAKWVDGMGPEPPELIHLGIPDVELEDMRQRAAVATLQRGS